MNGQLFDAYGYTVHPEERPNERPKNSAPFERIAWPLDLSDAQPERIRSESARRSTVGWNVGVSATACCPQSCADVQQPKPAPHRAYQRGRNKSQDQALKHLRGSALADRRRTYCAADCRSRD